MANRYWVGGTGTWDTTSTANWSATSGGAGGASAPTAADAAIFNASSGGGTVTLGESVDCLTVDFSGFTGTFDFSTFDVNVAGNAASIVVVTTTIAAITGTGKFNCLYAGSTGTRTITIGTGAVTKAANVAVSAGSDTLTFSSTAQMIDVDFTGFSGTWTTTTANNIYGSLTISAGMTVGSLGGSVVFAATTTGKTITTNGKTINQAIIFNGVGGSWQLVDNLTTGSTRTVTLTNGALDLNNNTLSCGLFSSSNSNTRSIAFGTGNITLTGSGATIWSQSTATGFTYTGTPTVNCTYAGSTGTRTIITGGGAGGSATTALNFAFSAGTDTLGIAGNGHINNLNFTGFAGTLANGARNIYGNLTISSGMSLDAGTLTTTFAATSGTKTITINGKTLDFPITFNGIGGTWEFADALTQGSTRAFTITNGTVKLKAGSTSTVGAFATSGSNQKYLQSTTSGSQATLSQASGTVNVSTLTIQDINATGGATWQAFLTNGNINSGNNAGWDWYYQPGEYMYTRRKLKRLLIQ